MSEYFYIFVLARKILDYRLWTSPQKIIRKSHIALSRDFNEDSIANGDLYFRNISDKCIRQVISTCEITPECFESELIDDFSGYALTHQVLHLHIFKKVSKCIYLRWFGHCFFFYVKQTWFNAYCVYFECKTYHQTYYSCRWTVPIRHFYKWRTK